ncbi:MAG: ABC transporter permease [Candidatus Competibacterales bacterium]
MEHPQNGAEVALLPLFVPGVTLGVAAAVCFQLLGLAPSLLTIGVVQTLWALPFAFLIILTSMASFDPRFLEAAYVSGANRRQAFVEVELPLIARGIGGAALFSVILSFNETLRTTTVQGSYNTIQTLIWSRYQQVGLTPDLYALMSLIIAGTLGLMATWLLFDALADARRGTSSPSSSQST